jgi:hypothetical protein
MAGAATQRAGDRRAVAPGIKVNHKTVESLMAGLGLQGLCGRRKLKTTRQDARVPPHGTSSSAISAPSGAIVNSCGRDFCLGCDGPSLYNVQLGLGWPPLLQFAVNERGAGSHEWDQFGSGYLVPAGLGGVEELVGHGQGSSA